MTEPVSAFKVIGEFTSLAKELARLPEVAFPQYRPAAIALYEICHQLLISNENTSRWYYRFLYFDFRAPNSQMKFFDTVKEYKAMKTGPEFYSLKFRCGDIRLIYQDKIESKFGSWILDKVKFRKRLGAFSDAQSRINEARRTIDQLAIADGSWIDFIVDSVFYRIDQFVEKAEVAVEGGDFDRAEQERLEFKAQTKDIGQFLEKSGATLTDLVIDFAKIAGVPITIGSSR